MNNNACIKKSISTQKKLFFTIPFPLLILPDIKEGQ